MKILYLHGLNGYLKPEKKKILTSYGDTIVHAPSIDYQNNPDAILWLYQQFKEKEIHAIIGSSMGGFAGYYLAKLMQKPALLYNPALAYRSVEQSIPEVPDSSENTIHIVLGLKDEVIDPTSTMNFLSEHKSQPQDYVLTLKHDLGHRIPLDVFEKTYFNFIGTLIF